MALIEIHATNEQDGKKDIPRQIQFWTNEILKTRLALADHITKKHGGLPQTACHDCMSTLAKIQDNTLFLGELQNRLSSRK